MKIKSYPIIKHDILTLQLTKITGTCKTKIPTKTEDCDIMQNYCIPDLESAYHIRFSELLSFYSAMTSLTPPPQHTVFLTSHQSLVLP